MTTVEQVEFLETKLTEAVDEFKQWAAINGFDVSQGEPIGDDKGFSNDRTRAAWFGWQASIIKGWMKNESCHDSSSW